MPHEARIATVDQLEAWLKSEGEVHIHRVRATSKGFVRFFIVTSTADLPACTTKNCLRYTP